MHQPQLDPGREAVLVHGVALAGQVPVHAPATYNLQPHRSTVLFDGARAELPQILTRSIANRSAASQAAMSMPGATRNAA